MKNGTGSKITDLLSHLEILNLDPKFQPKEILIFHLCLCAFFFLNELQPDRKRPKSPNSASWLCFFSLCPAYFFFRLLWSTSTAALGVGSWWPWLGSERHHEPQHSMGNLILRNSAGLGVYIYVYIFVCLFVSGLGACLFWGSGWVCSSSCI